MASKLAERLQQFRVDAYWNPSTGIGGSQDKRIGGVINVQPLDYQTCADLYRDNDMAARIADAMPNDCVRRGWDLSVQGDNGHEISEKLAAKVDELETKKHLRQAHRWAKAFGGAGVFVGANDGQTADLPLDLKKVKSVDFLLPLDTLELVANSYYSDPLEPKYGLPETYRLNRFGAISPMPTGAQGLARQGGLAGLVSGGPTLRGGLAEINRSATWNFLPIVHESRILRFEGVFINRILLRSNRYWGDSVYVRCQEVLRDFGLSWSSAALLIQDFTQAVYRLPGFSEMLAEQGPAAFIAAEQMIEQSRRMVRAIYLDKDHEFQRTQQPVTGLPDLLVQMSKRLAAAADMPVTRLFGEAPAGLNATGEQDGEWWADKVAGEQEDVLRPALNRLYTILFAAKDGVTAGKEPDNWHIKFRPLKEPSELEQADRRLKVAQADQIYLAEGVVTPEEVAATRFGGDEYSGEKIQLLEADPEKRALAAEEAAERPPGPGDEPPDDEPGGEQEEK